MALQKLKEFVQRTLVIWSCIGKRVLFPDGRKIRFGKSVKIMQPSSGGIISISGNALIHSYTLIGTHEPKSKLTIGKNCDIGERSRIVALNSVEIGDNVLTGPSVFISDANHQYRDIRLPIMSQGLYVPHNGHISIGCGTWIGVNAAIVGNVTIGRNCVIAANSVVTCNIPDYCVAAGNPARIVKRYNSDTCAWEKI